MALGRAMVRDPKVFLLDEPLSNLDARLRIRMRRDLKALHERIGSTIVYVTHDQAEAMSMSSRIAVFDKGRLQQFGTPQEIYHRPANLFVANFVGEREVLFLEADAELEDNRLLIRTNGGLLTVEDVPPSFGAVDGRRAVLGIRPEAVRLVAAGSAGAMPAMVSEVEPSGPDLVVFATVEAGIDLSCRVDGGMDVARGERVALALVPERLLAFDPATGAALPLGG